MEDLRTPPSEAKQLYHALKIRKIPTVLVEIPGASHNISKRPSNLIKKVETTYVLAWLENISSVSGNYDYNLKIVNIVRFFKITIFRT